MLSRNMLKAVRASNQFNQFNMSRRVFSTTEVGIADMPDVFKVNYTEEFDQGLTDE